ncbi:preprotein translocase subunit SecA [Oscillospiraceae bacterium 50-60]
MENGVGRWKGAGRVRDAIREILNLEGSMRALSEADLRRKTPEFRKRLLEGETLDSLLPEAFAAVREAARRVLGMEHFPVQLAGGIVLHQGNIAEMRTGEGKTLVATLPAYLNALTGQGVHVVTVNDYLAGRDRDQMGRVHEFLGLSTGVVLGGMKGPERQAAYACDITYVTNHELGFDYLRDNMALRLDQVVQRGLAYAIIDEVDSILIDEARTPLIISGEGSRPAKLYGACDFLARRLKRGEDLKELSKLDMISGVEQEETGDFVVVEKERRAVLTAAGVEKVERFFRLENLADPENVEVQRHMNLALRANCLMERDRDYVVQDGEVRIVDGFTGRTMPGRRYSDGLHQAIEAKERVKIQKESRTVASITYQSFFNKYRKKAGMTGTAKTEEEEFQKIYSMDIVEIPTNRPVLRQDRQDVLYRTREEKLEAVCDAAVQSAGMGRPVLIGTVSVSTSEDLSRRLSERGVPHSVLNAKQHEREAAVVAQAGRAGAVTIATNMAGRGTDIKLDAAAAAAGGLLVIGTERHDSRRVDNQLRGRSGRQGDPGESCFYLSLEDDLLRLFGQRRMAAAFDALGVREGQGVVNIMLTKAVERAQRRLEGDHFAMRTRLLEYDQVVNEQREVVYRQRRQVLEAERIGEIIGRMVRSAAANQAEAAALEAAAGSLPEELKRTALLQAVDRQWMNHIDDLEQLREGVGLIGYAQKDPVDEYRRAASELFERMNERIRQDVLLAVLALAEKEESV